MQERSIVEVQVDEWNWKGKTKTRKERKKRGKIEKHALVSDIPT
jgi:hypothetical protein